MITIKEIAIESIKRMPDNITAEDIMYEINFISQVIEGLKDSEADRTITTEELLSRIERWQR